IVLAAEHPGRTAIWMQRAGAERREGPPAQARLGYVDLVHVKVGVEQRAVDILPFSGALAMQQGEAHGHRGRNSRRAVVHGYWKLWRTAIGFSDGMGDARIGGAHIVEAGLLTERPALAGQRNRAHDEARMYGPEVVIAEACARHHSRRKIFNEHVDF